MAVHKKMWVSIITPSLNSEKYIQETIESINCQTYKNIEHIVVDGGSTDGTLDIVKRYKGIRLLHGPDNGMYDGINKGLKIARGEIVAYLNSDDLYFPGTIEIAVNSFICWPKVEFIYGDCYYIDENGKILFKYYFPQFDWGFFLMRKGSPIAQPTTFWRKSIHDKYGFFDPSYKLVGDWEFFIRVFSGGLVRHCSHSMAKFRIHSQQACTKMRVERIQESERVNKVWERARQANHNSVQWKELRVKLMNWRAILKKTLLRLRGKWGLN